MAMPQHHGLITLLIFILIIHSVDSNVPDPCLSYTVLNDLWRATNNSNGALHCDQSVDWSGWYRLQYNGLDAVMPQTCVPSYTCGTNVPLWINGSHPQLQDGVMTVQICGNWNSACCQYRSNPIQVKACLGNYFVYQFVKPSDCWLAYCAEIIQPKKMRRGIRLKLSSSQKLTDPAATGAFLTELKVKLLQNGLPANDTITLRDIQQQIDFESTPSNLGNC